MGGRLWRGQGREGEQTPAAPLSWGHLLIAGTWRRLRISWLCTWGPLEGAEGQRSSWWRHGGPEGLASFPSRSRGEFWGYVEMGSMEGPGEAESAQFRL